MKKSTFQQRLETYKKTYDIDDNTSPNDIANLHTIINNQLMIEKIDSSVNILLESDSIEDTVSQAVAMKKLQDARRDLIDQNMSIERLLGIDRKSRKTNTQESVAEYIQFLKTAAKEFLDQQLIVVSCPECKIMLGRLLPVHEHTEFEARFQCSQCRKIGIVKRKERDIFYDLREKNKDWRKKYPIEIIQPGKDVVEDETDIFIDDMMQDEDSTTEHQESE